MFRLINGAVVAGLTLLLVAGCSTGSERGDFRRFLTDPKDLNEFPVDDRRKLRDEYNRLPQQMVVRIPRDNDGRLNPDQAEARYFDQRVNFDDKQIPMHRRWSQGRDSDRVAIAHHMSHIADHRKFHRKHHRHHYYGKGWKYRYYTPYYRSAYNSGYWWGNYTYYRSYYPVGSRYEYCVYYPRRHQRSYSYSYPGYFNYSYY